MVEGHSTEDTEEEIWDMDRRTLGFHELGDYESYLDDNFPNSAFYADILAKFEVINSLYRKYDDFSIVFDKLSTNLNADNPSGTVKMIYERLMEVTDIPRVADAENITDSEIEEIQLWANAQYERVSEIANIDTLPDIITFGETVRIKGVDGSEALLSIGDNQISPAAGSEEIIDICFSDGNKNTVKGYIKLVVGYLDFDEDGGAADGLSDDIEYECDNILEELDSFIGVQNCEVEKDTQITEIINNVINADADNT